MNIYKNSQVILNVPILKGEFSESDRGTVNCADNKEWLFI